MKYANDVLIVEDDRNLRWMLKENLQNEGFVPFLASDGEEASQMIQEQDFKLYVLDIMLPGRDGLSLAKEIREKDAIAPILFLTARSMKNDIIAGFNLGADDYVVKPFDIDELVCRMRALLRRSAHPVQEEVEEVMEVGEMRFFPDQRMLEHEGDEIVLSPRESDLFLVLARNPNKTIPRQEILYQLWGRDDEYTSKSLDVYLTRLRKHVSDYAGCIKNIRGLGYRFEPLSVVHS